MKYILTAIGLNLVSMSAIVWAGYLAMQGKEGWGWFLFVGLLCLQSVRYINEKK